ncbi:MAG: Rpn family recombination-promoting nuclease/putative transposase, partial [Alphaproteobacteria bacterium]|nr:Rpn family recombination-promoting nuclease/putative transposase [Alphaproteobacteria bacterium]
FIIELQKTKQKFFKDRSLYYSTFPIVEQAEKSEWDYKLQPVYLVAILDFVFDEDKNDSNRFLYKVKLTDLETCKVFYEKLTFVYIEMPKYKKKLEESKDQFERWLWLINHLNKIEEIPAELKQPVFQKLFEEAEIAKFSRQEQLDYENSLKIYRDSNNSLGTARAEGFQEGMDRKEREIISKLKARGMSADEISEILK